MADKKTVYTIGYSNPTLKTNKDLIKTVKDCGINCLVDIRSVPYSKRFPTYNKEYFNSYCLDHDVLYVHRAALGANVSVFSNDSCKSKACDILNVKGLFPVLAKNRPEHTILNKDDLIVDFEAVTNDSAFMEAIKELRDACFEEKLTPCLMCCEAHPKDCHRYFLVAKALLDTYGDEIEVVHITPEGKLSYDQTDSAGNAYLSQKLVEKEALENLPHALPNVDPENFTMDNLYKFLNILHGWK